MGKDMRKMVCLMYHALYSTDDEYQRLPKGEKGYAIHVDTFSEQLAFLQANTAVVDPAASMAMASTAGEKVNVLITFDDGHISNYTHAFPLLRKFGMRAIFFVTTDFIESHDGYCRWEQLKKMSAAGMSIQSHGKTHRFFGDMDKSGELEEFRHSRERIADNTGGHVNSISFPGGRYSALSLKRGADCGYQYFYSSAPGLNHLPLQAGTDLIRRIAVKQSMNMESFARFACADRWTLARATVLSLAKTALKRMLGNTLYHLLYRRLSS
jgi:peptidoglycan/xylan/chitin deacetylase (PgdA/CDA1 family)